MFFVVTLLVCFVLFMPLTSFFNRKHKVLISFASALVVSIFASGVGTILSEQYFGGDVSGLLYHREYQHVQKRPVEAELGDIIQYIGGNARPFFYLL